MGEYDEFDEVDIAMTCSLTEQEEYFMNKDIENGYQYSDEVELESAEINASHILLDESDTDPIGMEAEDELDAEQEVLFGDEDEDNELIDMIASNENY